jgi:hypothetical protein
MAATGYTPIILFNSTTASNAPTTSNLAVGELALNVPDGKLYFNQSGTIKVLASNAAVTPVTTFSAGTTGLTPSSATSGAVTLAGTLVVGNGGTGLTTLATGSLTYGAGTSAFSTLAIGTANQILTVNTGATAPQWSTLSGVAVTTISFGSTGLTPATATSGAVTVAGTLAIANGGTGQTTASAAFNALSPITTAGDLILGNGTNSATRLAIGANTYVLTSNGTTASWAAPASGGVTAVSVTSANGFAGTSSGGATPALTLSTTITGVLKGNATAISAATAGTDYVDPTVATTFTAKQTFNGTSATEALKVLNIAEPANVVAAAPSATTNFYINSGSVQYYTSNTTNNWTLNFAFSSGTSLNTAMSTGDSISCTLLTTNSTTAYYPSAFTVDGTSVTPKWQGGTAPTSGDVSALDSYTFVIIKTASATYTILATATKFA